MIIQIQGGTYCDDPHVYHDDQGNWCPSATQILKLNGLSDYDGVDEDVLDNAARRGSLVHDLAASYQKYEEVDPSWITTEVVGYFDAYLRFLTDTGFMPIGDWIEKGIICSIHGMRVGLTPDIYGKIARDNWVIEIKCTSGVQHSWSIQTALQEMGIHGSNHVGRCRRGALQLFRNGRYKLHPHTNHAEDEAVAIAALRLTWWRHNHGQNLQKKLQLA